MKTRLIILLIGFSFVGCSSPEKEIVGKWKYIKKVKNGVEIEGTPVERDDILELEFSQNKEIIRWRNGKLYSLAGCKYEQKGDSIFQTCAYDDTQDFTLGAYFKLINDTLILEEDSVQSYYLRND